MAEEEIALSVKILTEGAGQSITELRRQFKELNTELQNSEKGTEKYTQALHALGRVKGDMDDLRQKINALNPERQFAAIAKIGSTVASGFAAAQAAFALFGSESEDLMKILVKVQAATALASGLQGLVGFQRALTTAGLAMKAFAMSNPFTAIAAGVVALVVVIYSLVRAYDDSKEKAENLTEANDALAESYKHIGEQADLTVKRLKATGASEQEIFEAQWRAHDRQIANIKERIANKKAEFELIVDITEEQFKELTDLNNEYDIALKKREIFKLEFHKEMTEKGLKVTSEAMDKAKDAADKAEAKKEKEAEKAAEAWKKFVDENQKAVQKLRDENYAAEIKMNTERLSLVDKFFLDAKEKRDKDAQDKFDEDTAEFDRESAKGEKRKREVIAYEKKLADEKLQLQDNYFNALRGMSDIFFMGALNRAKGNEKAELEIKKRQFKVGKAFDAARVIMDTSRAIIATLAEIPPPAGTPFAIGMGVLGAVNLAKILATKFDGGEAGGGADGSSSIPSPPSIESPQAQQQAVTATQTQTNQQGDFTGFTNNGQKESSPLRAYVVETDISETQKTIRGIEDRAKF